MPIDSRGLEVLGSPKSSLPLHFCPGTRPRRTNGQPIFSSICLNSKDIRPNVHFGPTIADLEKHETANDKRHHGLRRRMRR